MFLSKGFETFQMTREHFLNRFDFYCNLGITNDSINFHTRIGTPIG